MEHSKYRIYEQFLKQESAADNIKFLKNEYGVGGAYPALRDRDLSEDHDAKGIRLRKGADTTLLLPWKRIEKRIREFVAQERYLTEEDRARYPAYRQERMQRAERAAIAKEFRAIVYDYNDFVKGTGETDKALNLYVLSDCWSNFAVGHKETHTRTIQGEFIIPLMRETMETIIADNTHLTGRCQAMLVQLQSEAAKPLEPTYNELHPRPDPEREYRLELGDEIFLGTQKFELVGIYETEVALFDPSFPLLTKTMSREEFDAKLRENPLNDKYLQVVEESPEEDQPDYAEPEPEEVMEPEPEPIAPPAPAQKAKAPPHILHPEVTSAQRHDFRITDNDLGVGTPSQRYANNVAAIRLLKQLEDEDRLATPEEQTILSRYVGWGGLADCFDEKHTKYAELKSLLTDEEYAAARESTLTAFYTPPVVIQAVYQALENMHFQTGNILEPSCGVGNFFGLLPESMQSSRLFGVELDSISGRIAQQLYQNASIAVQGFEKTDLADSFFDAAIGNVPFGPFKVGDRRYDKHNFLIHDYFFGATRS